MKKMIWTRTMRDFLYEVLTSRFGPQSTWNNIDSPGNEREEGFRIFCQNFADLVGAKSGKAVEQQIAFALRVPNGTTHFPRNLARSYILNRAAAFNAGLISHSSFPQLSVSEGGSA